MSRPSSSSYNYGRKRRVSDTYDEEDTPRLGSHDNPPSGSNPHGAFLRPGTAGHGLLRRRSTATIQKAYDNYGSPEKRTVSARPNLRTVQSDASMQQPHEASSSRPTLGRATSSKGGVPSLRSSLIRGTALPAAPQDSDKADLKPRVSVASAMSYKERVSLLRRQSREIFEHVEREYSYLRLTTPSHASYLSLRGSRRLHSRPCANPPSVRRPVTPYRVAAGICG